MTPSASPRVSVVIATYNWSEALRLSLVSALAQTLEEIEVLVVGDGCTDDSEQVVAERGDARARWIGLDENSGGQSAPNNAGIDAARSPWIAYLGHDDLWHARHLELLLAAAEQSRADLAYAIGILYGPPDSDLRWASGVTRSGQPERDVFLPPSTILHRRSLTERIGPWRPPRETELPVDVDWQLRAWDAGARFVGGGDATVFKFPAAWRRDAYRERRVDEQRTLALRLEREPGLVERELVDVIRAFVTGAGVVPGVPDPQPPGAFAAANRQLKGVGALSSDSPPREAALIFDQPVAGHEWYATESDPHDRPFRWSGPLTRSTVILSVDTRAELELDLRVLLAIAPDVLEGLRLEVHGTAIPLRANASPGGGWQFSGVIPQQVAAAGDRHQLRLDLHVPRTVSPRDIDPGSADARPLGIALSWLGVRRTSGRSARPGGRTWVDRLRALGRRAR